MLRTWEALYHNGLRYYVHPKCPSGASGLSVNNKLVNSLYSFFHRWIWRHSFGRMLAILSMLWLTATLALFYTEGPSNPGFDSLHKVFWNIAVYLFSGLDSAQPETPAGQIIVTIVLAISVGIVAVFTGMIASFLVESRIGSRRRMPKYNLSDHIVICNWNSKAIPIIRELHEEIIKNKRSIVVVSEQADAAELPEQEDDPAFEDVFLVKGDPANEIVLKRACVQNAYSVLILADPAEGHLADAKSILISMAVRAACIDSDPVHICVEGIDPASSAHLKRAGADEIVGASDFTMMLLAQSSLAHGLSVVYHNLLNVSSDTNEIYLLPVPESFVGKPFAALGAAMFQHRAADNPAILIGVINQEGIQINPHPGKLPNFAKDDQIIVIAFECPDRLVP